MPTSQEHNPEPKSPWKYLPNWVQAAWKLPLIRIICVAALPVGTLIFAMVQAYAVENKEIITRTLWDTSLAYLPSTTPINKVLLGCLVVWGIAAFIWVAKLKRAGRIAPLKPENGEVLSTDEFRVLACIFERSTITRGNLTLQLGFVRRENELNDIINRLYFPHGFIAMGLVDGGGAKMTITSKGEEYAAKRGIQRNAPSLTDQNEMLSKQVEELKTENARLRAHQK